MEKKEREWVAMMLAELHYVGMRNLSEHYRHVLFNIDPLLEKEYFACIRTFKSVERTERRNRDKC